MDLLYWLVSVASKVYQWFGYQYDSLYNGALNAWNWAYNLAMQAYTNAVNYAVTLLDGFRDDLSSILDWVQAQFKKLRQDVADDINGLYDWVQYQINNLGDLAQQAAQGLIDAVYKFINSVPQAIRDWINNAISSASKIITNLFGWITPIKQKILDLLASMATINISTLYTFLTKFYTLVVNFFDDPGYFIYNLVWPSFITFLCFIIAYALGTSKYDLPQRPNFRKDSLPK